mgnify:CR=1 FL=1
MCIRDSYYTDEITSHAVRMIEESAVGSAPFFSYVAYTAPHWPLHALEEDIGRITVHQCPRLPWIIGQPFANRLKRNILLRNCTHCHQITANSTTCVNSAQPRRRPKMRVNSGNGARSMSGAHKNFNE